jgi:hypothetical protein
MGRVRRGEAMADAAWASIGFAGVVVFGWIVEGLVRAVAAWAWSHFH